MGVHLKAVARLMPAPLVSSSLVNRQWPSWEATRRGVQPLLSVQLTFGPQVISSWLPAFDHDHPKRGDNHVESIYHPLKPIQAITRASPPPTFQSTAVAMASSLPQPMRHDECSVPWHCVPHLTAGRQVVRGWLDPRCCWTRWRPARLFQADLAIQTKVASCRGSSALLVKFQVLFPLTPASTFFQLRSQRTKRTSQKLHPISCRQLQLSPLEHLAWISQAIDSTWCRHCRPPAPLRDSIQKCDQVRVLDVLKVLNRQNLSFGKRRCQVNSPGSR